MLTKILNIKFFKSLFEFLKNSKRIVHIGVFIACLCISAFQLAECLKKLQQPPVSTHYRFALNETLDYPAVTVCRNPPYKSHVLQYYNLGQQNSSVEHSSEWQNFPFDKATLQQVWDNATYRKDEVVRLYGLHGESANAEVKEYYYFYHGRCFTFLPRVGATQPWPNSGWSIMLQHMDWKNYNNPNKRLGLATLSEANGFHVYVHEVREPWTENLAQTKYIMQYLYVEVGEEIEIKLNADEFKGISTKRRPCLADVNYSRYKCVEQRWWTNISQEAGCTAPWMRGVVGLPHCNRYEPLLELLNSYTNFTDSDDQQCQLFPCNVTSYKVQVVKRQAIHPSFSQIYMYFTSKLVTVMEELPGYDYTAFIADLGGSLGFFLGISVFGALGLLEKTWGVMVCLARPEKKEEETKKEEAAEKEKVPEKSLNI